MSFFQDRFSSKIETIGIGSVDIPTKTSPTQTGPSSHGTLHLDKVLHFPGAFCNIIGRPVVNDYRVITEFTESQSGSITSYSDGSPVAYFKPYGPDAPLFEL